MVFGNDCGMYIVEILLNVVGRSAGSAAGVGLDTTTRDTLSVASFCSRRASVLLVEATVARSPWCVDGALASLLEACIRRERQRRA